MTPSDNGLLARDEPSPARVLNAGGQSAFLVIGDHAGNLVPHRLGGLGLAERDLDRHIAWDIGVRDLGTGLAKALDAPFIWQSYSRLVIDCNRAPTHPDAAPGVSDKTRIPANLSLRADALAERTDKIHAPYHASIADILDQRAQDKRETILIALHSFTPVLGDGPRPWHVGVLHDAGNDAYALALLAALRDHSGIIVGDNEPYRMDATDYTVPRHAYARGLGYAEIEVRQDLLADAAGIARWCGILSVACSAARNALDAS